MDDQGYDTYSLTYTFPVQVSRSTHSEYALRIVESYTKVNPNVSLIINFRFFCRKRTLLDVVRLEASLTKGAAIDGKELGGSENIETGYRTH